MATDSTVGFSLDDYFQTTPIGSLDKAIGNNLYGLNHQCIPGMVPSNKELYGYTFFVRPQLNLQADNIRNNRILMPLLSGASMSMQRAIRCTLDPRLMIGYSQSREKVSPITCPLVDNLNAFIPILSNNLNSISGFPDTTAPTYTSKSGLYNEAYTMVDGISQYAEALDIDASFRNTRGDPILYMFYIWIRYASLCFEGKAVPYLDFITENEIDYNTRIYRLVMDETKTTVTKIAAVGAAIPVSSPTGGAFDFNNDKPYNDQNKDITIKFKCMGVDVFDDILINDFNKTVCAFNPAMKDKHRGTYMVKLSKLLAGTFNHRGYPRINPSTHELEWYVGKSMFSARTSAFIKANLADPEVQDSEETGD